MAAIFGERVVPADPFRYVDVGVKDLANVRLLDPHHGEQPLAVSILPGIRPFSPSFAPFGKQAV